MVSPPMPVSREPRVRRIWHASRVSRAIAWRLHFLLGRNPFSARERLAYVNPLRRQLTLAELVAQSRRRARDGTEFYRLGGLRIFVRPGVELDDPRAYREAVELVLRETYLRNEQTCAEADVRPGDVVLDLGGHVGTCALEFARRCRPHGVVHSFEPLTPEVIEQNARANGFGNVKVVAAGIADREGTADLQLTDECVDASIARRPGRGERSVRTRRIPLTTIDAYVEREGLTRIDFVKMDIEGAEELALHGARRTIQRFRPRWSIASYHTDHEGEKQHGKLVRLLRYLGYRLREVEQKRIFAW